MKPAEMKDFWAAIQCMQYAAIGPKTTIACLVQDRPAKAVVFFLCVCEP